MVNAVEIYPEEPPKWKVLSQVIEEISSAAKEMGITKLSLCVHKHVSPFCFVLVYLVSKCIKLVTYLCKGSKILVAANDERTCYQLREVNDEFMMFVLFVVYLCMYFYLRNKYLLLLLVLMRWWE